VPHWLQTFNRLQEHYWSRTPSAQLADQHPGANRAGQQPCSAVVLKPWAAGYPFYYRALHKWEHYVPLRPDLSDLPERVRWLQAHDAEAEAIGRRAAAFARAALSPASIDSYVAALLRTTAAEQPDASALEPADGDVPVYRRGGSWAYSVLNATDHKGRRLDVVCPAAAADRALLEVSPAANVARQYVESAEIKYLKSEKIKG